MHPTWAGDLFHPTCFDAVLLKHPTLAFSHRVQKSVLYICVSFSLFTFMHWRRKWQPTPVFLPGESQDRGAWWAAVYRVAQSRTPLKRLSSSSMFSAFFPLGKEKAVLNSVNRDSVGNCFARIYCDLPLFMYKAVLITGHLKSLLTNQVESIEILPCLDDQIHKKMCLILGAHS